MNVDYFGCFDVIFLEKKRSMQLPFQKKVFIPPLRFKNCAKILDFLEIRCYAKSVVITHFFKMKHQSAFCLFVLAKLRFPRASKHLL